MMKAFLAATAILEITTGIALMALPEVVVWILLGAPLGTPAGVIIARLAGAALFSLGIACWSVSRDAQSRAASRIAAAMLFYNIAAAGLLMSARYGAGMSGIGLVPAAVLHAAFGVWCVVCLRSSLSGAPPAQSQFHLR
jgi:hypothetical protein